jgi:lipoprotein-anchoring transpeptidase ErfK/SrfK
MGEEVYNPSGWYHGKYDPDLQKQDMNRDGQDDIFIVLNNDIAGPGNPRKDIHIINKAFSPYLNSYVLKYEEAQVEPIKSAINRLTKIEQHGNIVTLVVGEKKYSINLVPYYFKNPRNPIVSPESVEYSIEDGNLIATTTAYVVRDNSVLGGFLGNIKIEYKWDGKRYTANKITFKQAKPEIQK